MRKRWSKHGIQGRCDEITNRRKVMKVALNGIGAVLSLIFGVLVLIAVAYIVAHSKK